MKDKLTLVVLAAGIGSRYGGLKQIDPMGPNGEIILDYSVYDALRAGFSKVVFVISPAIEKLFRERMQGTVERHVETAYVFQRLDDVPMGCTVPAGRVKPWGTAHAVLASRDAVTTPFAVINADDYYGPQAYRAVADYLRGPHPDDGVADYCMVGYRLGNTLTEHGHVARAICTVDQNGYLVHAQERTRIERYGDVARYTEDGETWTVLPLDAVVSMNIWGFTPQVYGQLAESFPRFLAANAANLEKAEFYIPNFVAELIRDGRARVKVLSTPERWHGVTYAQDKPQVKTAIRELVAAGLYPEKLWD
ncbi:MAG: sugar phosphate nucleotidyltransferase [Anaerolineae bacterium]